MSAPRPDPDALWAPSPARAAGTNVDGFRRHVAASEGVELADTVALHTWSVAHPDRFWAHVWERCGVVGDRGEEVLDPGDGTMLGTRFFPRARLNYAENLLSNPLPGEQPALIAVREDGLERTVSWDELRAEVAAATAALRADGVGPGDRVVAWMPNVVETTVVMLATLSLGAVFSSTSPDFGVDGVVDRFGQITPTVLIAADGYRYGGRAFDCLARLGPIVARLPTLRRVVVVPHLGTEPALPADPVPGMVGWGSWLAPHRGAALWFQRVGFDHPGFVLYSSGTTGKPKCIVHRAGGVLLMHLYEQQLHNDLRAGDRFLYFTTCGWMMWNWLVSGLATGATVVLYEGSPGHPAPTNLFDVADRLDVAVLGTSAKYLDSTRKAGATLTTTHTFGQLRTLCSTGSPLPPDSYRWVYEAVKADVHLASISGGTDLCGCLVGGDPTRPVHAGELTGPALGLATDVVDDEGRSLRDRPGERGELVCTQAFPSMPVGFWDDPDGGRYRGTYFERFPGIWAQGDFASWTTHDGIVIHGRSDTTLNASGVRIGTAELYAAVEPLDEVLESVAVAQEWDDDTRIVLFVRLADGVALDDELAGRIRTAVRTRCSPRHVPARIVAVDEVPRTRSGKLAEVAVTDAVNGRPPRPSGLEGLANAECLVQFTRRPELAV